MTTTTITPLPEWTPTVRMTVLGFTREQWAVIDSENVNRRIGILDELRAAADRNAGPGGWTYFAGAVKRAERALLRAMTYCTNSGQLRTECTTCDHTRQLALMARRAA